MDNPNYVLKLKDAIKYTLLGLPVLIVGIFLLLVGLFDNGDRSSLLLSLPLWAFALYNWVKYLRRPMEIYVYDDKAVLKDFLGRKKSIELAKIKIIETNTTKALMIRTKENDYLGINGFIDFPRFIDDVRKANPDLIVK